ncbi:hypothetical protein Agub_g317, partial [Astrephomene gubernaculifera]
LRWRGVSGGGGDGGWSAWEVVRHWLTVAAAAVLALAAALAKEIGITVLGCMLVADLLLVPVVVRGLPYDNGGGGGCGYRPRTAMKAETVHNKHVEGKSKASDYSGRNGGGGGGGAVPAVWRFVRHALRLAQAVTADPKLPRLVFLAVVGWGYVGLRRRVAVEQLVRIYRKVENPIPFSPSRLERALSTAHLHARYARLLLLPYPLSADWSFNCLPLVRKLTD